MKVKNGRRASFKKLGLGLATLFGVSSVRAYETEEPSFKTANNIKDFQGVPLFSGSTRVGNLIFIAGKGAHTEPFEIKAHTEIVLKELEKELIKAGSSMDKVVKVSVFLNDIADYQAMNEVYKGRFGDKPPVRTTVAVAQGGVPGDSLVEMDCIAYV
ncbi:RidA family protein [Euzebyella marina]|uniref:RidA family protein n=1 Tax=Euzebyella marina TaxID=1761453 RepID=A0A3G2LAK6_9FLAO|nr:RidA family protein [Euzebyella marina]AYN69296.1 RidA family protein [Euzebyella marina]